MSSHSSVQLTPMHRPRQTGHRNHQRHNREDMRGALGLGGGGGRHDHPRTMIHRWAHRLSQIEQAEARQAGGLEQLALQILLFEHGELRRGHFAAIGAELEIELAAGCEKAASSVWRERARAIILSSSAVRRRSRSSRS